MKRTLLLAMTGLAAAAIGGTLFGRSETAGASGLTLYGSVAVPDGDVSLDFVFRDPKARAEVARTSAVAQVKDGLYTVTLPGGTLPAGGGLYAIEVAQSGATVQSTFVNL